MKVTVSGSLALCFSIGAALLYGWITLDADSHEISPPQNETEATVCMILADDVYDTRQVSTLDAYSLIASEVALPNACDCSSLCYDYPYFHRAGPRCKCLETTQPNAVDLTTMPQRQLIPDDFFDGDDLGVCRLISECSRLKACPRHQRCVSNTTSGFCNCQPILCASRYGNPCGPASACFDTPTGYNCTPLVTNACPAGCGPNSTCKPIATFPVPKSECVCDTGFARPNRLLGCVSA